MICGVVYAELFAYPSATEQFVKRFIDTTEIQVDFDLGDAAWQDRARSFENYAERRRFNGSLAKRLLADFMVGSHALHRADRLLTLDSSRYKADFPTLKLLP